MTTSMRKMRRNAVVESKASGFILGNNREDNRGSTEHTEWAKSVVCSWKKEKAQFWVPIRPKSTRKLEVLKSMVKNFHEQWRGPKCRLCLPKSLKLSRHDRSTFETSDGISHPQWRWCRWAQNWWTGPKCCQRKHNPSMKPLTRWMTSEPLRAPRSSLHRIETIGKAWAELREELNFWKISFKKSSYKKGLVFAPYSEENHSPLLMLLNPFLVTTVKSENELLQLF